MWFYFEEGGDANQCPEYKSSGMSTMTAIWK